MPQLHKKTNNGFVIPNHLNRSTAMTNENPHFYFYNINLAKSVPLVQVSSSNGFRRNKRGAKSTPCAIMKLLRYPSGDCSRIKTSPLAKGRQFVKMVNCTVPIIGFPFLRIFNSFGKVKEWFKGTSTVILCMLTDSGPGETERCKTQ